MQLRVWKQDHQSESLSFNTPDLSFPYPRTLLALGRKGQELMPLCKWETFYEVCKCSILSSLKKKNKKIRQPGRNGFTTLTPGKALRVARGEVESCPGEQLPEDGGCPEGPGAGWLRTGPGSPDPGTSPREGQWAMKSSRRPASAGQGRATAVRGEQRLSTGTGGAGGERRPGAAPLPYRFGVFFLHLVVVSEPLGREIQAFSLRPRAAAAGHRRV